LPTTFREALLRDYSITQPTPKFLKAITHRANAAPLLGDLLAPERRQDLTTYLWGMEVIDFLTEHPSARFRPEEFVGLLTKLQPRLYSVASSLKAYPEQVHFIVDVVRYESHGRIRKGVCSSFLAERADHVPVPVFPSIAKHFHLPEDPDVPIIMVGPELEWRRSARICRNARRPEQTEELAFFRIAASKVRFCLRRRVRGI
jgi:sulfite reductase (NADPH) flavoprotein alpha-component